MLRLVAAVSLWFLSLNYALAAPASEARNNVIFDETDLDGEIQMLSGRLEEENNNLKFYEKILHRVLARNDKPDEHEILLLQDQISTAKYNVMSLEKTIKAVRQRFNSGSMDFADITDNRHQEHHQDHHHDHHHDPHQHHEHHHFHEQRLAQ